MVTILFSEKDLNINNNRNLNNKIFFKTSTGRGSGFDIAKILFFKYKKLLQLNRNHIKTKNINKAINFDGYKWKQEHTPNNANSQSKWVEITASYELLYRLKNIIKTELEHKTVLKKLKELSEKKMGVEYNVKSRHAAF